MRWWKKFWNKLIKWIDTMTCEKKSIEAFKRLALPHEHITIEEKAKIKSICSANLGLPWYVIADIVFQERVMKKAIGRVSLQIANLTEEELAWIYDCVRSSQLGIDDLIQFIRKARSSGTALPTP